MPNDHASSPSDDEKQLRIKFEVPEEPPVHTTTTVIQHTDHEFIVRHYQIYPPLLLGTDEEKQATLDELDHVDAVCVGQFVMAPERIEGMIKALTENLEKWRANQAAKQQSSTQ